MAILTEDFRRQSDKDRHILLHVGEVDYTRGHGTGIPRWDILSQQKILPGTGTENRRDQLEQILDQREMRKTHGGKPFCLGVVVGDHVARGDGGYLI